ncbi:MAG: hypothetical protein DMD72_05060 [Gemmatimonadetes bacterium]|nr:MAG: hypothetical protein DMD72_05060 [Gemmatimonadota bacterium]PYO80747.1 MAG: hypothetical protein DMD63_00170 [Gemmatimonadota bacterium]
MEAHENARGALRASRRGAAHGNHPLVGRAVANRPHGSRAGDPPLAKVDVGAAVGRVEEAVAVVDRRLPWPG